MFVHTRDETLGTLFMPSCILCADEGWNTIQYFAMLVEMRGGTQYSIHLLCNLCMDEEWNIIQYSFVMQILVLPTIATCACR